MLYTRKGDKGTTQLFDTKKGIRVSKSSLIAEALGSLDELNSFLGLCKVSAKSERSMVCGRTVAEILEEVQENLFIVQAELAGAEKYITSEKIVAVEKIIDMIEREIPPIRGFSIAGGTGVSAFLDVARTIARRTERVAISVCEAEERDLTEHSRQYINRLSSLLFALARFVNYNAGVKEKNPKYK